MGYAAGLIGLAAPMAVVAALLRYTGRADRRRRQELLASTRPASPPAPVKLEENKDSFRAWQAGFADQADPAEDDKP